MPSYTSQWEQLLDISERVSRSEIEVGNIYKISVYSGLDYKTVRKDRYIFTLGKDENDNIHCLKLNEIQPLDFSNFIYSIRNKQITPDSDKSLKEHLIKLPSKGKRVYESYIKPNKNLLRGYRVYKPTRITYISEIVFQKNILEQLLSPTAKITNRRIIIDEEVDLNDD